MTTCEPDTVPYGEEGPPGLERHHGLDLHYRKLAAKLLGVDWLKFNSDGECCEGMGRLPWNWELQVIERVCELISEMTEDKWGRMITYNYRKLQLLRNALKIKKPKKKPRQARASDEQLRKVMAKYEQGLEDRLWRNIADFHRTGGKMYKLNTLYSMKRRYDRQRTKSEK